VRTNSVVYVDGVPDAPDAPDAPDEPDEPGTVPAGAKPLDPIPGGSATFAP
jgi:hypothetical protein